MREKLSPKQITGLGSAIAMALYALSQFLSDSLQRYILFAVVAFIIFCLLSNPLFRKIRKGNNQTAAHRPLTSNRAEDE
jgi:hypothetical protein